MVCIIVSMSSVPGLNPGHVPNHNIGVYQGHNPWCVFRVTQHTQATYWLNIIYVSYVENAYLYVLESLYDDVEILYFYMYISIV